MKKKGEGEVSAVGGEEGGWMTSGMDGAWVDELSRLDATALQDFEDVPSTGKQVSHGRPNEHSRAGTGRGGSYPEGGCGHSGGLPPNATLHARVDTIRRPRRLQRGLESRRRRQRGENGPIERTWTSGDGGERS